MNVYEVALNRVVEHETIYRIKANSEEAIELVLSGDYDYIAHDTEINNIEEPSLNNIETIAICN